MIEINDLGNSLVLQGPLRKSQHNVLFRTILWCSWVNVVCAFSLEKVAGVLSVSRVFCPYLPKSIKYKFQKSLYKFIKRDLLNSKKNDKCLLRSSGQYLRDTLVPYSGVDIVQPPFLVSWADLEVCYTIQQKLLHTHMYIHTYFDVLWNLKSWPKVFLECLRNAAWGNLLHVLLHFLHPNSKMMERPRGPRPGSPYQIK